MSYLLLSISGHDRAGIVRDVSEALLHLNANIEDSSMTALRGRFTMMLIVKLADGDGFGTLKAALAELEQRTGLTVQSQRISAEEAAIVPQEPDCVVTVTGADRPGIVYEITDVLAANGVSIVDVSTRSRETDNRGDVYMMALEAFSDGKAESLRAPLEAAANRLGVDVEVHILDEAVI
ncbi:MAG: ACT domain-containing protein [Mariprofundaceae bacterium]|nr:ACT domain-containing protein [Mariprofundaceae bacterium]